MGLGVCRIRIVVLMAVLMAAAGCGGGSPPNTSPRTPTVAVLRSVQSPEPQNVEAFLAELAREGFAVGTTLRLLGGDPAEVHPDPAEAESTVREWGRERLDLVLALSSAGALAAARGHRRRRCCSCRTIRLPPD